MKLRSWFIGATIVAGAACAAVAALAAVAWHTLAAREGQWSYPLRATVAGHAFERAIGIDTLLRLGTHPLAARAVDGQALNTAHGRWQLHARGDRSVLARCAPCRLALPALGPAPLAVESAELRLQAEGADRYRGTLTLGGGGRSLAFVGNARFDRQGDLAIDARLARTALADVVRVLGTDLPERDVVQVQGTLALTLKAKHQHGPWRIDPQVEGFEVAGLGSERFADLQRPPACRNDANAGVNTIEGWLPRAVIAAEDARFHEHPGYDLKAMADALARNQRPGSTLAGASTLTQQLAKLVVTGGERSASRKLRELLYAVEMERTLGKARILQLYLALAPWGDGVCGAERAARVHLGQRDASALGPVASAWLASLLTAPDAHLHGEWTAGEVDQARVSRVLDAMRLRAERREKAQMQLLFWAPPALARLREAAAPRDAAMPASENTQASPPVAPSP